MGFDYSGEVGFMIGSFMPTLSNVVCYREGRLLLVQALEHVLAYWQP